MEKRIEKSFRVPSNFSGELYIRSHCGEKLRSHCGEKPNEYNDGQITLRRRKHVWNLEPNHLSFLANLSQRVKMFN